MGVILPACGHRQHLLQQGQKHCTEGREQQERKVEGLVRARGPTNKPREEVSLGSGDRSNSCTRDQHHKIFMSLAFCKKPT